MLITKESVEFVRKNITSLIFLLSNCLELLKIFYDKPVKNSFDDFGI